MASLRHERPVPLEPDFRVRSSIFPHNFRCFAKHDRRIRAARSDRWNRRLRQIAQQPVLEFQSNRQASGHVEARQISASDQEESRTVRPQCRSQPEPVAQTLSKNRERERSQGEACAGTCSRLRNRSVFVERRCPADAAHEGILSRRFITIRFKLRKQSFVAAADLWAAR
jgi:hypothetical protein